MTHIGTSFELSHGTEPPSVTVHFPGRTGYINRQLHNVCGVAACVVRANVIDFLKELLTVSQTTHYQHQQHNTAKTDRDIETVRR